MTNHDDVPGQFPALVWAVIFTILLSSRLCSFANREAAMAAFAKSWRRE
jgi:hypothetical protein